MSARETGAVELKPCRIFGETEARQAWISAEQVLLESYVDEYEMCCDDGYYTPTEQERELIRDALQGFVVEHDDLLATHLALNSRPQPTPAGEIVERLNRKTQGAGAWLTSDVRAFYIEVRDLIEQQAATIAERDAENGRLRQEISNAVEALRGLPEHLLRRDQPNSAKEVADVRDRLRATLERTARQ